MITLPSPPRRVQLQAFWVTLCIVLASGSILVCAVMGSRWGVIGTGIGWIAIGSLGVVGNDWIRPFYSFWNKGCKRVSQWSGILVTGVCYYVVFATVSIAGAKFGGKESAMSGWSRREEEKIGERLARERELIVSSGRLGWISGYLRWAIGSRNSWAICLLPFLVILAWVSEEEDETIPAFIYTLF